MAKAALRPWETYVKSRHAARRVSDDACDGANFVHRAMWRKRDERGWPPRVAAPGSAVLASVLACASGPHKVRTITTDSLYREL